MLLRLLFCFGLFCFIVNSSIAQTVLLNDPGKTYNDTDGPTNDIYGTVDISNCTSVRFELDYSFSLPWEGSGNMESADECGLGLCAGDPSNPTSLACTNCWDFLWAQFFIDGTEVGSDLVGEAGTTDAEQSGSMSYQQCNMGGTTASIEITTQTWAGNESITFGPLQIICWEGVPTADANPDPICEGEVLALTGTVGDNGVVQNVDWSGPGTIADPSSLTTTATDFSAPNATYTLTIEDVNGCTAEDMVTVIVNSTPMANPAGPLEECEDPAGSGQATFDLTSLNDIINGGSGETILWFEDMALTTPITSSSSYTTSSRNVYAIIESDEGCRSEPIEIMLVVIPPPIANPAGPLEECEDPAGSGQATFDLSSLDDDVNGGSGDNVLWFEDMALNTSISDPSNHTTSTTIVYSVVENAQGCRSLAVEVELEVIASPSANPAGPLEQCEDPAGSGQASFDLSLLEDDINGGSGETVLWFEDMAGTNTIADPSNFTTGSTTVYAFVESDEGCLSIAVPVVLTVVSAPESFPAGPLEQCDDGSGLGTFDLRSLDDIVNGGSGEPVLWFEDIDLNFPIGNPNNFISGSVTVFAVVETSGSCRSEVQSIELILVPKPQTGIAGPLQECENPAGSGQATFDLRVLDDDINLGSGEMVLWFEDMALIMPITDPENYVSGSSTIYAIVESVEGCRSDPVEIELEIITSPEAFDAGPMEECEDSFGSGQAAFNLRLLDDQINGGSGQPVVWYTDQNLTNVINDPTNYISSGATVYAIVEISADCKSQVIEVELQVNPIPEIFPVGPIESCEDSLGFAIYNLNDLVDSINGNTGNSVSFYENYDGVDLSNEILTPENHRTNATVVYAQVMENTCFSDVLAIQLISYDFIDLANLDTISVCPDENGSAVVDLYDYEPDLLNGSSGSISWYEQDQMTLISDPGNYQILVTTSVYAIANEQTICPSDFQVLTFELSNGVAYLNPDNPYMVCSDNNGIVTLNLNDYLDSIYTGSGTGIWLNSMLDTIRVINAYRSSLPDSLYLSISEGRCSTDSLIEFIFVEADPLEAVPAELSACDSGDGRAWFDLVSLNDIVDPTGMNMVEYYVDTLMNPISPSFFISQSGTIYARVVDGNCRSEFVEIELSVEQMASVCGTSIDTCGPNGMYSIDLTQYNDEVNCNTGFTVRWFTDPSAVSTSEIMDPANFLTGSTSLWVIVGEGSCSSDTIEIPVNIMSSPTAFPGNLEVCEDNGMGVFDLESLENVINGGTGLSVEWFEDDMGTIPILNLNNYSSAVDRIVYARVNDNACYSMLVEVFLSIRARPGYSVPAISECDDGSGMAIFDLTSFEVDINATADVEWFFDLNATASIANPGSLYTSSSIVFARVFDGVCYSEVFGVPLVVETCACVTSAGLISADEPELCDDQLIQIDTSGNSFDGDDQVFIVIHDNPDILSSSTILYSNSLSWTRIDFGLDVNRIYYVTMAVGNALPDGTIDWSDMCLDFSNTIPFVFYPNINVWLESNDNGVCRGDSLDIVVRISGISSTNLQLNGPNFSMPLLQAADNDLIRISPQASGEWFLSDPSSSLNCFNSDSPIFIGISELVGSYNILSNYGPYNISCNGSNDGEVQILSSMGVDPISYLWPDGNMEEIRSDLAAGMYEVQLIDSIGCRDTLSFELLEPDPILIATSAEDPNCNNGSDGSVQIDSVTGGIGELSLSLNDSTIASLNGQSMPYSIDSLNAGTYEVGILDINNCYNSVSITLDNPPEIPLDIQSDLNGPEDMVEIGQTIELNVSSESAYDTVSWQMSYDFECLNPPICDMISISPLVSGQVGVIVVDQGGCISQAFYFINVNNDFTVFTPSGFSPNADARNDLFTLYSNHIVTILEFQVFDRWGNQLYLAQNFEPNIEQLGWDGSYKGEILNPGVYVWSAEVLFIDGSTKVLKGDVSLVK